jgi:hypothetical protein
MKQSKFEQLWGTEISKDKKGSKETILKNLIPGLVVLTTQDVYYLFIDAFEQGSNYWAQIENIDEIRTATSDMNGEPISERTLMALKRGVGVEFFDLEENKPVKEKMTFESFAKAEKHLLQHERQIIGAIFTEQSDSITADAFLQACVLGSVVYG